jgi:hypothetical protein
VNVTVTQATAPGNVRAYPGGTAVPNTSNVNHLPGQARATLVRRPSSRAPAGRRYYGSFPGGGPPSS